MARNTKSRRSIIVVVGRFTELAGQELKLNEPVLLHEQLVEFETDIRNNCPRLSERIDQELVSFFSESVPAESSPPE
jgi:hypothetical protein